MSNKARPKLTLPPAPKMGETEDVPQAASPVGDGAIHADPITAQNRLRMEDPCCGNCIYFVVGPDGENGQCREDSPKPLVTGFTQRNPSLLKPGEHEQPLPIVNGFFPLTHRIVWCGKHPAIAGAKIATN